MHPPGRTHAHTHNHTCMLYKRTFLFTRAAAAGQVRRQFEGMFADLHHACQTAAAAAASSSAPPLGEMACGLGHASALPAQRRLPYLEQVPGIACDATWLAGMRVGAHPKFGHA